MSTTARGTNGIVFQVDIASVDTTIGLLEAIQTPKATVKTERVEPIDSDHNVPVYVGRIDNETATFSVYFDPLDTAHIYLVNISHDPEHADAGALKTWTTSFPVDGLGDWIFTGILESFEIKSEKASLFKGDGTIQVEESTQLPAAS